MSLDKFSRTTWLPPKGHLIPYSDGIQSQGQLPYSVGNRELFDAHPNVGINPRRAQGEEQAWGISMSQGCL